MDVAGSRERHRAQRALLRAGERLVVGNADDCPLAPASLAAITGDESYVRQVLPGGLTARVYRLRLGDRDWTLKIKREPVLVQNEDGQLSFLTEVQRRADFTRLKAEPGGRERFAAIVDTQYASLHEGIILSPWIDGCAVTEWSEQRLTQLFDVLAEMVMAGLFEWDLSSGNVLDDGRLRLFDFGYAYPFDPLREFNSEGLALPQYHAIERFESRNYFAHLLRMERSRGQTAALRAFQMEKMIALECYRRLGKRLDVAAATSTVRAWLGAIIERWRKALSGDLAGLYLAEGWRSHSLDLDDDLGGKSCTPLTVERADWLLRVAREEYAALRHHGALLEAQAAMSSAKLVRSLFEKRDQAVRHQLLVT